MIFLNVLEPCVKTCLTPWHLGGFGDFCKKTAVFGCLTNVLASPPIALESCSMAQRIGQSSRLHSKKSLPGGCRFFVSDVISGGLLGHFGPLCLALSANR